MTTEGPKKTLVLHVTVPGFYADDLDARTYADGEPGPEERLEVVLEEWMRQEVGITLSDDFEVHAYTGRVVGAELRDREAIDG